MKDIGEMRHIVMVQRPMREQSAYATAPGRIVSYEDFTKLRCAIRDMSGREFFAQAAEVRENIKTFETRSRKDITEEMRLYYDGQGYEIVYIDRYTQGRYMKIKARALKG